MYICKYIYIIVYIYTQYSQYYEDKGLFNYYMKTAGYLPTIYGILS